MNVPGLLYDSLIILSLLHFYKCAYIIPIKLRDQGCQQLSQEELEEILGPAFNPRYMSVMPPISEDDPLNPGKRTLSSSLPFKVEETYKAQISESPAWDIRNHAKLEIDLSNRRKRNFMFSEEWKCEGDITWMDLGPDYFPQFIRHVECKVGNCWFGIFTCKPRSFSIKLLKRMRNKCVRNSMKFRTGKDGLPAELLEMWVWEERPVTFCCECSR